MLFMDRHDLGRDDGFVAEVRIVVAVLLEEDIFLGEVVGGKEIFDFGVFIVGFLVLLFSPVIAAI